MCFDFSEAAIDYKDNTINGNRSLRDVCRHDNFPRVERCRLEDLNLVVEGHFSVAGLTKDRLLLEWFHLGVVLYLVFELPYKVCDLFLSSEEDQNRT